MKYKIYLVRYLVYFFGLSSSFAQIDFQVNWTPYVTYYLSMVDINTGESNMPIFSAELSRDEDGLTLENSALKFFTVATLRYQLD